MPQLPLKDEEDILSENINDALFLSLGILSATVSVIIVVHVAATALFSQLLLSDLPLRSIVAALFFVIGGGLFHVFRKRRQTRKEKYSAFS